MDQHKNSTAADSNQGQVTDSAPPSGPMAGAPPRIAIFVVAYNAVNTLRKVLDRIPGPVREQIEEVFVFDDASPDDTYLVGRGYKEVSGWDKLKIFRNEANLGYGGNQKTGYRYAIERGFDYVVLLHGDGQYAPEVMQTVLEPLLEGRADAVFGSRMLEKGNARKGGMPLYKLWGNRILTKYQNWLTGAALSEWHSGYRAYRVDALKKLALHEDSDDFHFDTEIILQLLDQGFRMEEVPIPVFYGDEICHVNGMKYAANVVRAVWDYKLHRTGSRKDARFIVPKERYFLKSGPHSSHTTIAAMVPPGTRVLDLGCDPQIAASFLNQGCQVVGVNNELLPGHEKLAGFYQRDLEQPLALDEPPGSFDVVVMQDVIAKMKNGERLLAESRDLLKEGGMLIVSVANIAFIQTRLQLLSGRFNYGWRGILDYDHLRFFTKKTLKQIVKSSSYEPLKLKAVPAPLDALAPEQSTRLWHRAASLVLLGLARVWPGMFAFQFIIQAKPVKGCGLSGDIQE